MGGTEFLPLFPFLTPYLQVRLWKVARVWERTERNMHWTLKLGLLFLCFKKIYINASLGKYSVILYSSRLQGLTCLAHSSEKKVFNLMFSSLAIVGIYRSSWLCCPLLYILSAYCHFPRATSLLFIHDCCLSLLDPSTAIKEPCTGSCFVFISKPSPWCKHP